jgi:DNA (cytosine-5)-methyltransferase 1
MRKPKLLDLYCCAGGAAKGYAQAGFDVTGVDKEPQPNYPFAFIQGDAIEYLLAHGHEYDAIHASPPCQGYSQCRFTPGASGKDYPLLIEPTLAALRAIGKPWVMENVPGSGLSDLVLCGTSFGLNVQRHRHFAASFMLMHTGPCNHREGNLGIYANKVTRLGTRGVAYIAGSGRKHYRPLPAPFAEGEAAMGIDWMNRYELSQSIPPAYTNFIGQQLMQIIHKQLQQAA